MSEEFEIDGNTYRANPMDARIQLHVVRRVTPLVAAIPGMLGGNDLMKSFLPLAEALAGMEDKEVDYVLDKCLGVVQRKQDGDRQWANIWNSRAQQLMFEEIQLPTMLRITARVLIDQIGPFFPALASKLNGAAGAQITKP